MTATQETFVIRKRVLVEVNTDPQRRCYDGVHFSSEQRFTEWGLLASGVQADAVERQLKFWRELNEFAVRERGKIGTLAEFEAVAEQGEQA